MKFTQMFERMGLLEKGNQDSSVFSGFDDERSPQSMLEGADLAADIDSEKRLPDENAEEASQALVVEIDELRSLEDIYADAKIPDSPFSADKLLKLLEGLNTLPEEVRKQAIMAMDAAEDEWTIEDPLLDAQRRIQALEAEQQRLEQQASGAESNAESDLKAQDQYQEQASAQIRKQIRELEELLEQELKTIAEARENIKATAKAARKTCQRQQSNLDKEAKRLKLISELFALTDDDTTNPSNPSGTENG